MLYKAHKIELYTTKRQEQYLLQCVGAERFAYNALVDYFNKADKIPTKRLFLDRILELRREHTWMQDFSTRVVRESVNNLQTAITKAFSKEEVAKRSAKVAKAKKLGDKRLVAKAYKHGFPNFHRKGLNDSFSIREKEKIKLKDRRLRFEKMPKHLSGLRLRESLRFKGAIKEMTISYKAGKWFVSLLVDTDNIIKRKPSKCDVIGVDLGIKTLATLSNGETFPNIKSLQRKLRKLKTLDKEVSRRYVKGKKAKDQSKNWHKSQHKKARLHYYVAQKRQAILHELTDYLTANFDTIVIEDLNVSGMLKNKRLSRLLSDVGLFEFRRQMEYKSLWREKNLVIAPQYFPSSKKCSNCGNVKDVLSLSERTYRCRECNMIKDRDLNASINLEQVATRSSDTINDYGEVA